MLLDLFEAPDSVVTAKLGAPWLDLDRIRARLTAAAQFLSSVTVTGSVRGWEGTPLLFLQHSPEKEDVAEQRKRMTDELFRACHPFAYTHPAGSYLFSNFFPVLEITGDEQGLMIAPMMAFTSAGLLSCDTLYPLFRGKPSHAYGYRVPDYPSLLGVSGTTASELIARILVHDIGHSFLPSVELSEESLHNAVMIHASQLPAPPATALTPWEQCVLSECTDPYFFVQGENYISPLLSRQLPPLQTAILNLWASMYLPTVTTRRRRIWGLQDTMSIDERKSRVDLILDELLQSNFSHYDPRKRPVA